MKRSEKRILTTHVGSLPRPDDLTEKLMARDRSELQDEAAFEALVSERVKECVALQMKAGIDVVNDGEWSKPDYSTYIKNRLAGFEGQPTPRDESRDMLDFPEYAPYRARSGLTDLERPNCNGRSPGRTSRQSSATLKT